jgi:hypothetical protein
MPRNRESNLELLLKLPWWVSAVLGVASFIALRYIIPAKLDHNQALHPFAVALPKLAFLLLALFALIAVGSFLFARKRHRLVDEQTSLEKLRETAWKDFEYLVAEAFRRQGYQVEFSLGRGADGGVDLTLRRDGRTALVQCKQWKVFSVGAPVIIDPAGTYYLSPLLQFSEAKELHVQQAELATLAFLERNPKDFDNPDLLKLLFLKPALGKAQDERIQESVEFRAKQLHQKVEIGRIDILATRENEVLAAVTGQIIRSGIFQDRAFTEAFPFTLRLRLIRNPNMALNGRFPTAVGDFKYEINR